MEVRRRVLRALMIVPLVLACVAGVARAEVYYNDTGTEYQAIIAGYEYGEAGRHRATMEYLGYDWDSIGSVQQARLRTNSGGKNPYMAVYESCQNLQYDWNGGAFDWPIINVWSGIFGLSNMWLVGGVSAEDYEVARQYVLKVITGTGGDEGGGMGGEDTGTYRIYKWTNVLSETDIKGFCVEEARADEFEQNVDKYQGGGFFCVYAPTTCGFGVATNSPVVNYDNTNGAEGPYPCINFPVGTLGGNWSYNGAYNLRSIEGEKYILFGSEAIPRLDGVYSGTWNPTIANGNRPVNAYYYGKLSGVNPSPEPPEPDPPTVAPTPPEQPTYVFEPVLGVDFPTITIESDPISDEVIDWLKLIHRDLSRISQEMNDYIEDASNAIVAAINNQGAALRRWFDTLSTQINDVYIYLVTMQERYLNELDRDITTWLKRIYSRLGGNGAAEPDPNEDDKGFWDWILEQLQKFFVGNVDDAADGIKGLLQQLTEFFPFSLPWDLMALFGLFAAEPVTPVFDVQLPVPAVIAADYGEPLHIDLHQWDGIMIVVRGLEKIFFAAWLISMVPTWLNDIKVGDM